MLEGLTPPPRKWNCKVKQEADGLSPSDKKILLEAVDNPAWKFKTLQKELGKRGIVIVDTTLSRHRNKACGCYRD